jgi:hypothetical protein
MNESIPELTFTLWYRWEKRNSIDGANNPGVYVLAITDEDLEGQRVQLSQVCYVGMSNSKKGLKGRWGQFARAVKGKSGLHSGGDTIFNDIGSYEDWNRQLFVAACPVVCNVGSSSPEDLRKMGIVAYLEYEALAQFVEGNSKCSRPKYNKK